MGGNTEKTAVASIYKRGGIYWGRAERNGRLRRKSLKTASAKIARQRLAKWVAQLEGLGFGEKPDHTFDDAAVKFTAEHLPSIKPKSRKRYDVSIDALTRTFEGVPLAKIRSDKLMEFVTMRRGDGVTPGTIRRDLACLSSIFGMAAVWQWTEVNPVPAFLKVMKPRGLREAPARRRYLSHDEEAALLAAAAPHVAQAIAFAIDTGLRLEEQFSLTWAQVDPKRPELKVWGSTSKNAKDRSVPLLPRALGIVNALPQHIKLPFVFWHRDKRKREKRFGNLDKGLRAAARRAKIDDLRWHDLRRTCGCRLLQDRSFTMAQVRDWLGHSSVLVTERAYAFLESDALHTAAGTIPGTADCEE